MVCPLTHLVVHVVDPRQQDGDVYYKIGLAHIDRPDRTLFTVMRTYKDTKSTVKKLRTILSSMLEKDTSIDEALPDIPRTPIFGAFEDSFLEERRCAFERFFNSILSNALLRSDMDFLRVIGYDEYRAAHQAERMQQGRQDGKKGGSRHQDAMAGGNVDMASNLDRLTSTSLTTYLTSTPITATMGANAMTATTDASTYEEHITAARVVFRSTKYKFLKPLPVLGSMGTPGIASTHSGGGAGAGRSGTTATWRNLPPRKAHCIVEAPTGEPLLVSIFFLDMFRAPLGLLGVMPSEDESTPPDMTKQPDQATIDAAAKTVKRFLTSLDPMYFAPVVDFLVGNGRAFVVKYCTKTGSLADELCQVKNPLLTSEQKYFGLMTTSAAAGASGSSSSNVKKSTSSGVTAAVSSSAPAGGGGSNMMVIKGSPFSLDMLTKHSYKLLQIIAACHMYDISLPQLTSLGNLLVGQKYGMVLSDMEDVICGATRLPAIAAGDQDMWIAGLGTSVAGPNGMTVEYDSRIVGMYERQQRRRLAEEAKAEGIDLTESISVTSIPHPARTRQDILLFGALFLQMALGVVLPVDDERLAKLLTCQGDPLDRAPMMDEEGGESSGAASAMVEASSDMSGRSATTSDRSILLQLPQLFPSFLSLPPSVINLVHYIFHPSLCADIRVLLHHSFFASAAEAERKAFVSEMTARQAAQEQYEAAMLVRGTEASAAMSVAVMSTTTGKPSKSSSSKTPAASSIVAPPAALQMDNDEGGDAYHGDGVPMLKFKKKDLSLVYEAQHRSLEDLSRREAEREKLKREREAARDLKRQGTGPAQGGSSSSGGNATLAVPSGGMGKVSPGPQKAPASPTKTAKAPAVPGGAPTAPASPKVAGGAPAAPAAPAAPPAPAPTPAAAPAPAPPPAPAPAPPPPAPVAPPPPKAIPPPPPPGGAPAPPAGLPPPPPPPPKGLPPPPPPKGPPPPPPPR